jgi:hypothetical protein
MTTIAGLALFLATINPSVGGSSSIPGDNVVGAPVDPSSALDASCYGSGFRIGTGNVPMHNDRPTTIVNIWAELSPSSKIATAWIAKNVARQYWIQVNDRTAGDPQLPPADRIPRQMTTFTQYDAIFARMNVATTPCFTHELPKKFYEYTTVQPMQFPMSHPAPSTLVN